MTPRRGNRILFRSSQLVDVSKSLSLYCNSQEISGHTWTAHFRWLFLRRQLQAFEGRS